MKLLLFLYEIMSGLKINFNKSEVIMILGYEERGQQIDDLFTCQVGGFCRCFRPATY
jgi:hypothetical protein